MNKSFLEKHSKAKAFADRWISTLKEEGYSYEEMLQVFRLARKKMEFYLSQNNE